MVSKRSLRTKKKIDPNERLKIMDKLHRDMEARIMMTDDNEELLLMGSLFLTIGRNIFVAIHGAKKAKLIIGEFCDNIKEEQT